MNLRSLQKEIRLHLDAKPENQDKLIDYVRNCGPKLPPLRKGTTFVKNALEWYELLRLKGKGRKVMAIDDVSRRAIGFHIFDNFKNGNVKHGETFMVSLSVFKEGMPIRFRKFFASPGKRAEFCEKLTAGKAPKIPKSIMG